MLRRLVSSVTRTCRPILTRVLGGCHWSFRPWANPNYAHATRCCAGTMETRVMVGSSPLSIEVEGIAEEAPENQATSRKILNIVAGKSICIHGPLTNIYSTDSRCCWLREMQSKGPWEHPAIPKRQLDRRFRGKNKKTRYPCLRASGRRAHAWLLRR